jgi:hypothetical protein
MSHADWRHRTKRKGIVKFKVGILEKNVLAGH